MNFDPQKLRALKAGEPITEDWIAAVSGMCAVMASLTGTGLSIGGSGAGFRGGLVGTRVLARILAPADAGDAPSHHNQDTENGVDGSWWQWQEVQIDATPTDPLDQADRYPAHYRTNRRRHGVDGCALNLSGETAAVGQCVFLTQVAMDDGTLVWVFESTGIVRFAEVTGVTWNDTVNRGEYTLGGGALQDDGTWASDSTTLTTDATNLIEIPNDGSDIEGSSIDLGAPDTDYVTALGVLSVGLIDDIDVIEVRGNPIVVYWVVKGHYYFQYENYNKVALYLS